MIAAVIGFGIGALAFAAVAVALAIRNGGLDGDNRLLIGDRNRLLETLKETSDALADAKLRAERLEFAHGRERRRIYAQIKEKYGDAAVGDLAVGDIERLLSPPETGADDDPNG